MAQSGLYAVQGLGILADGAVARAIGAPLAVGLAGLVGLTGQLGTGTYERRLLTKVSAIEAPSASSGITIQAHR